MLVARPGNERNAAWLPPEPPAAAPGVIGKTLRGATTAERPIISVTHNLLSTTSVLRIRVIIFRVNFVEQILNHYYHSC